MVTVAQTTESNVSDSSDRPEYIFIKGVTKSGRKFRPSDWADRLYGAVATYASESEQNKKLIADSVCLIERDGIKGIVVNPLLNKLEPQLFRFMDSFAADNALTMEKLDPQLWNYEHLRIVECPRRTFY